MSTHVTPAKIHPRSYTSTSPAPPPTSVPVEGISKAIPASSSGVVELAALQPKETTTTDSVPCLCVTPTPVELSSSTIVSSSSTKAETLPIVVVPELLIPAEAYPECLNRPGGGKDYLCCLCLFRNSNLDTSLTHVRKHLEVIIGCPVCGKGYQNAASLHKHGRHVHQIQILALESSVNIMSKEGV